MESDTWYRVPVVVRQRSGSTCKVWEKRRSGRRGGQGGFTDLFGRARKAGRLGWVERRRAESRTRFKRKVLRVNGAEVMPRPQQQQPSPARVFVRSLLPFSPLRASSLSWNSRRKRGEGEGGSEAPFSPADSLLSLSTLSLPVCSSSLFLLLSSSVAPFLVHFPLKNMPRSHFFVRRCSFFFLSLVSSHTFEMARSFPRAAPARTVANKYIECKLPTNFFHRFAYSRCACAGMYISIRRHLLSAFL